MGEVTRILDSIEKGDSKAAEQLLPLLYEELRRLASQKLAREPPGQTLDATGLVHEAYLRLVGTPPQSPPSQGGEGRVRWDSCGHFFAAAAEAMRRILIENARRKKSEKHGGNLQRVELAGNEPAANTTPYDLLELDEVITALAEEDDTAAKVVKLRFYAGLSVEEAGEALGIGRASAYRHWTYGRAWLRCRLAETRP